MTVKLYTLEAAAAELARRECALHGHSLNPIILIGESDPVALTCDRCGKLWEVIDSKSRAVNPLRCNESEAVQA